ncbi:hypothetical protein CPC735_000300 [Coccidioides posadasii C735 delta SOWgp]|uniref:Sin3-associated polypeptide Sap18 n=1 Tax=Coccidioides posadasii (strain C735) TaxID=222929 RepID=C5NZZ7_COCP7|nr:hypothetical protein CPC735_000300 [Coccidioides posadasii C735 delta SOWgp]EER29774.1 hypothetical protein CPC735_000300 [Coccidioides posadasii C735 delta SOWgp]|eukprot:XP_003071919.1 hypothetical protein CPC735_000300 [Coccidioides posadasii C735 delta SOWgp]
MASNAEPSSPGIDRETTTPFHLKLFYRQNSFHHLSDFPIPSSSGGTSAPPLPPHLQIYTWYSCSLRELTHLLTSCLPSLLPDPVVGTRLSFRLIYPDSKGQFVGFGGSGAPGAHDEGRGRYLSKDIGSVIIGPKADTGGKDSSTEVDSSRLQGEDADRTLQDVRFIIGDYVECAILPPLSDGSVAPPISSRSIAGSSAVGGGMRAFPPVRENGFGRPRALGGGMGRGGLASIPSGEWRRGERIPDSGGRAYSRGHLRNRGRPY